MPLFIKSCFSRSSNSFGRQPLSGCESAARFTEKVPQSSKRKKKVYLMSFGETEEVLEKDLFIIDFLLGSYLYRAIYILNQVRCQGLEANILSSSSQ